jgi:AmmeMemoRadiSam system protein A
MNRLRPADEDRLLAIARGSLAHGLRHGCALDAEPALEAAALGAPGASFVTLRRADATLRGCIGTLEAVRPLARDVAENAYAAAFRDPRFAPLVVAELPDLTLSISILGPYEPIAAGSAEELAARLRPGCDGLVLQQGERRATFLPEVWHSLADPHEFVRALERKAGITSWRTPVEALRYGTTMMGGPAVGAARSGRASEAPSPPR